MGRSRCSTQGGWGVGSILQWCSTLEPQGLDPLSIYVSLFILKFEQTSIQHVCDPKLVRKV